MSRWLVILASALLVLGVAWLAPQLFEGADERAGDWVWRLGAQTQAERRVLIIDIDDHSIAQVGAWPWSRTKVAELIQKIKAHHPAAIALDMAFPEPKPGDTELSQALAHSPVVLSQILALDGADIQAGQLSGALESPECRKIIPVASGYIGNAVHTGLRTGHITPRIASDGAVRHLPALICHEQKAYEALALAVIAAAGASPGRYELSPGEGWLSSPYRLKHPNSNLLDIPLDKQGDIRIPYRRARSAFASISAADVLSGQVPPELLKGALILVGATAFGLGDAVPTPHGGAVGGVEVHAQLISGLLDGTIPATPSQVWMLQLGLATAVTLVLLGITSWRRGQRYPAWLFPLTGVTLVICLLSLHAWALWHMNVWLGWAHVAAFSLSASLGLAALEHGRVRFERERLYQNFSAYLPEPVAARIALSEVRGVVDAERREVTVFFADIRNFSAYCEGRPPEEAAALLHVFFSTAVKTVEAHGGVIEEFVGDAIMALWDTSQTSGDHAQQALQAALALLEACRPLFPDTAPPGLEPLALGIGLETGQALVGSFGPMRRRTHGALGDTITIASRLTALTGDLAQPLLIGESAAARLQANPKSQALVNMGAFLLEGLRRSYKIFAPRIPPP